MAVPVKRIKIILAAIDFSTYSKNLLEYANEVSQITNARLVLVNIINEQEINTIRKTINSIRPNEFSLAKYLPQKIDSRRLQLKALVKKCAFKTSPSIKLVVDHGIPVEKILQIIEEEQADLLIIGPKGRSNLEGFLFGSVAEKLFKHSPIPVMSLRQGTHDCPSSKKDE